MDSPQYQFETISRPPSQDHILLLELQRKIDVLWKVANICPKCEKTQMQPSCVSGYYCPLCDSQKTKITDCATARPKGETYRGWKEDADISGLFY